jgi:ribosomal protein L11 methylase PrmA
VTFYVAEQFQPTQIVGVDIDQQLVQQARHQLWNRLQTANTNTNMDQHKRYPFNLRFEQV